MYSVLYIHTASAVQDRYSGQERSRRSATPNSEPSGQAAAARLHMGRKDSLYTSSAERFSCQPISYTRLFIDPYSHISSSYDNEHWQVVAVREEKGET